MQITFFAIPARGDTGLQEDLNRSCAGLPAR